MEEKLFWLKVVFRVCFHVEQLIALLDEPIWVQELKFELMNN